MSFATRLFPVADGAFFVTNELGWFGITASRVIRLSVRYRVSCHSGVSATIVSWILIADRPIRRC